MAACADNGASSPHTLIPHFFCFIPPMSSTTFGYNAAEDRIWMSNSLWSERLWITRNSAQQMLRLVGKVLEDSA